MINFWLSTALGSIHIAMAKSCLRAFYLSQYEFPQGTISFARNEITKSMLRGLNLDSSSITLSARFLGPKRVRESALVQAVMFDISLLAVCYKTAFSLWVRGKEVDQYGCLDWRLATGIHEVNTPAHSSVYLSCWTTHRFDCIFRMNFKAYWQVWHLQEMPFKL